MNWGPIVGQIASWLASLGITGLTAAAVAWTLFKWLGGRWIEDHFTKELEAFKAEKQTNLEKLRNVLNSETERLKADLNRFADRASLFHVREYQVLPEAWGLMNKAHGAASDAIGIYREYPDLDRMGQPQFSAWLERSELEQYQKEELVRSSNKNQHYIKILNWKQIAEAQRATAEFINYVILQGVFIDEPLGQKMMEAGINLRKAMIGRSISEQLDGRPYVAGETNLIQQAMNEVQAVAVVVSQVKNEIQQHLRNIRLEG